MTSRQQRAIQLIEAFERRAIGGVFPQIRRIEIAQGLRQRVLNPSLIDQGGSSLCGPSSLLFKLALGNPDRYVEFGISLFETGRGKLGELQIKTGSDLKAYNPPRSAIHPVDWMMAASIRDSENWFFDYQSVKDEVAGITMPSALSDWLTKVGFTDVTNETNTFFIKSLDNAKKANRLFAAGYQVSLFVNSNMLNASTQTKKSVTPDHWVVLTSTMQLYDQSVVFQVFTWGRGKFRVPAGGTLSASDFLDNYYGFVAAKPY